MSSQNLPAPFSFSDSHEEYLQIAPPREGLLRLGGQGRQYPVHFHRELELNLVVAGRARYFLGDRRYDLEPGSLVWLFPAQKHILLDRTASYQHWVVCFRTELVAYACRTEPDTPLLAENPTGWFCRRLAPDALERFHGVLTELSSRGREDAALFNTGLSYVLRLAWRLFQEAQTTADIKPLPAPVERAALLLRSPEGQELSIAQVAARVGVSAPYLSRLFSTHVGLSMPAFRNRYRVERFLQLVRRPGKTLLESALEAGFGSYAQCHRAVVAVTGTAPRAARS